MLLNYFVFVKNHIMHISKVCYSSSIKEMSKVILFGCCFILTWGYLLFTIYMEIPFLDLIFSYWSFLFLVPIIQSFVLVFFNPDIETHFYRNYNIQLFLILLREAFEENGYSETYSDYRKIVFDNDPLWRRIVPFMSRKIIIIIDSDKVVLLSKRKTTLQVTSFLSSISIV